MSFNEVSLLGLIVPLGGALGIFFWRAVQKKTKAEGKDMVMYQLIYLSFLPLYAMLGLIPGVKLLTTPIEMYAFAFLFGLVLGSIQSYSRSCYVDLIPPGSEAEFFGIYEISDKGSSWLGPLIASVCYQYTNSLRPAFIYLLLAVFIPYLMLKKCDVKQARRDCASLKMAMRIKAIKAARLGRSEKSFLSLASSFGKSASSIIQSSQSSTLSSAMSSSRNSSAAASSVADSSVHSASSAVSSSVYESGVDDEIMESVIEDLDSDDEEESKLKDVLRAAATGGTAPAAPAAPAAGDGVATSDKTE